jgi:hypothetical protein
VFKEWQKVMKKNAEAMLDNRELTGFIVPFIDKREVHFRHG